MWGHSSHNAQSLDSAISQMFCREKVSSHLDFLKENTEQKKFNANLVKNKTN